MKKLIAIAASVLILVWLYAQLDASLVLKVIASADWSYLALSLVLLMVLVAASAIRLVLLASIAGMDITKRQAFEATFVANALNLFLPGKAGDVFKASSMAGEDASRVPQAVALGIWEKLSELALLLLIGAVSFAVTTGDGRAAAGAAAFGVLALGLLLYWPSPRRLEGRMGRALALWSSTLSSLRSSWFRTVVVLVFSILIWIGHVAQICMMAAALGVSGDSTMWIAMAARIPIVVLAGLIPLTFMGIGTRDAAIVALMQPFMSKETAAALGVLFWLRYLVPGVIALPLLPRFFRLSGSHLLQLRKSRDTSQ